MHSIGLQSKREELTTARLEFVRIITRTITVLSFLILTGTISRQFSMDKFRSIVLTRCWRKDENKFM